MSFVRGAALLAIASSVLVSGCSMMPSREARGDRDRVFATQEDSPGGFNLFATARDPK